MSSITTPPATCPFDHSAHQPDQNVRKTSFQAVGGEPRVFVDDHGVWQVRGFEECRQILRGDATKQAGFNAEQVSLAASRMREPILFLEGERHHQLRSQTAKFFTPSTTKTQHRAVMERLTDQLVTRLEKNGGADLSELSLELAVGVAAHVIGLTRSSLKGLAQRIGRLAFNPTTANGLQRQWNVIGAPLNLLAFYLFDVRPAMAASRRAADDNTPQETVVSHVMKLGYKAHEVLGECVTYGAAGMLTTREFISVTVWHLLERPALRARYLVADELERHAILGEILRLEPVIGTIKRRATAAIHLSVGEVTFDIPSGALIYLNVYDANADTKTVGENPHDLCPVRPLPKSVQEPVLSFGDGHHRCPGSFIAFAETDIFLLRLLPLPIKLKSQPTLRFNPTIDGYEIRNLQLRLEGVTA